MPDKAAGPFVLDHVAFGVPDVSDVLSVLVEQLGGREFAAGPGIAFRWWQWEFARGALIEVIEPDGTPGGFVERFLAARGPGIHHITYKVPDLVVAAAHARSLGYEVVGYEDSHPAWKECFLHPKQAQGIVVQFAESHPELEPTGMSDLPFPDSPPAAAGPAKLLGVRVSATSADRARDQWERLLGGECERDGEVLRFRWNDSPLRVEVRVDPTAAEGPLGLEIIDPPPGIALDGPHPALGTRLFAAA